MVFDYSEYYNGLVSSSLVFVYISLIIIIGSSLIYLLAKLGVFNVNIIKGKSQLS